MELLLGDSACIVTAFTDDHRNAQPTRDQQRLIAEVGGVTARLNDEDAATLATVPACKHVKPNAARLQQFADRNHECGLARTAHRQIPDADHGLLQPTRREHTPVEQPVSQSSGGAINSRQGIHDGTPIRSTRAPTVLSVAPRWDSIAARAVPPSVFRWPAFSICSIMTS